MKVWINLSNRDATVEFRKEKPVLEKGKWVDAGHGYLCLCTKVFEESFGFVPRKGSCEQVVLKMERKAK